MASTRRRSALRGETVEAWPDDPARVAGTLALVHRAGIDVRRELCAYAEKVDLRAHPWQAAQVVCALGLAAPEASWRACVDSLAERPWAPWTCLAAQARMDAEIMARCERPLVESLRTKPPHIGGMGMSDAPETALTAITIEALARVRSRAAEEAVNRGQAFLRRWQFDPEVPAALEPALARGAFPASPIASVLRCDVSGHALLALLGERAEP